MAGDCSISFTNLSSEEVDVLNRAYAAMRRTERFETVAAEIMQNEAAKLPMGNVVPLPGTYSLEFAPPPITAPAAVPTTSSGPATASGPVDARGVPFNVTFHSGTVAEPGMNADGSWKKRRGHDAAGLKAYEAAYLGKSHAGVGPVDTSDTVQSAPVIPSSDVGNAPGASVTSGIAPGSFPPPLPPPSTVAAPPPGTPGYADFLELWIDLCKMNRATPELEKWIVDTHGGHPIGKDQFGGNVFAMDPVKRLAVYNVLKTFKPDYVAA